MAGPAADGTGGRGASIAAQVKDSAAVMSLDMTDVAQ